MNVRIIALIVLMNMSLFSFSQEKSKLLKTLDSWIKNPDKDISNELKKNAKDEKVKSAAEAKLICKGLELIHEKLQNSFSEKIENNLYSLTSLFQDISTRESAEYLNEHGIKLLLDGLNIIHLKKYETKSYGSTEMMILKMFALYKNDSGLSKLSELIDRNFKDDAYLWSIVLSEVSEDKKKYTMVIDKLAGKIPSGFLGITYLDMCNSIAIKSGEFRHPFNSQEGYNYLDSIVKNSEEENESYIISVTASVPFLTDSFSDKLLKQVSKRKNIDVQIEVAWAGAKLGKESYRNSLIEFAKDYRYSTKATEYLRELNLDGSIPREVNHPDFIALSEMCNWLAHPNEFGTYPDKAEIYDKRELYWPPTKDRRTLYIVKYVYKGHKEDGSDEIGIGLVGSVTFSLFSLEKLPAMKPIEIYAIHCNWELEQENYEDVKRGLDLLRKYNKNLE